MAEWIGYFRDLQAIPPWQWQMEPRTKRPTEWECMEALQRRFKNLEDQFSLVACEIPKEPDNGMQKCAH